MLVGALSPHVTVLSGRLEQRDPSGARILIGSPTIAREMSVSAIHCLLPLFPAFHDWWAQPFDRAAAI